MSGVTPPRMPMRLEVMGHLAMQNVADRRSGPSKQCQRRAAKHPKVAALQPQGQNVQAAVVETIRNDYAKERGELGKRGFPRASSPRAPMLPLSASARIVRQFSTSTVCGGVLEAARNMGHVCCARKE